MELKELNERAASIMKEVSEIKERHNAELKPHYDDIESLNSLFCDSKLLDSNGNTVKAGMILRDKKGTYFTVLRRYQQCFCEFLGNVQVEILKTGGKRSINVHYSELTDYTIVQQTEK